MNNLTEDDVPGAKLKFATIKDNTVADLKRWLACRNLPMTGRKNDLIERVQACIDNKKTHLIFVGIDNGIWWQKKCDPNQFFKSTTPDSCFLTPSAGWTSFPFKSIPRMFCYGVIQEFISSANLNSLESDESSDECFPVCGNSKCMQRGRISFKSGHVQNVEDNTYKSMYYLRAKIMSSFKSNTTYNAYIILNEESKIVDSGCQCKASESKSCSHVIALLFMLEDYTLVFGFEPPTCTSKLKEWNKGRKRGNDPQNIFDANYSNQTKGKKRKQVVDFNPNGVLNCPVVNKEQLATSLLRSVQSLNKPSMWDFLLQFKYENYLLTDNEELLLKAKVDNLLENLTPRIEGPVQIKVKQNSKQWLNERRLRITASQCKSFFTSKDVTNLVREKLWSGETDISHLPQIAYGRLHEDDAFQQYASVINLPVKKVGFFINRALPGLGCSPDGLISDENGKVVGLIEIKCPLKLELISPYNLHKLDKPDKMFYTLTTDGIHIKRNHAYYFQVQLSLAILELQYCDFIVWSKTHCFAVERIYKDESFIKSLTTRLLTIEKNIAAEYFEMRLPRELPLLSIYKSNEIN